MADEMTDTTTTVTEPSESPATEQSAPATDTPAGDAPAAETPADPAAEETVLGGALSEERPEEAPAGAPEAYELAMDGVELDAELITEAEPILRDLNLSNEQANKLVPMAAKIVDRTTNEILGKMTEAFEQQRADWLAVAKADETIGGAKWDESVHLAAKGLDTLGYTKGHPFREALTKTGFGNNRDMIFLAKTLGELVGEDGTFVRSDAGAATTDAPLWERMYPEKK